MRVRLVLMTILAMTLAGCQAVTTADMVSIPDFVTDASKAASATGGTRAAAAPAAAAAAAAFDAKYQSIKAAAGKADTTRAARAAPASDSPHVIALLSTDVVQGVVDEVYSVRAKGVRAPAPLKLGDSKIREFRNALAQTRATLLDDVARGKAGGKQLDRILLAYFKAFASGEFVDRNGTEIAKPSVNGGINNEAITGLATIF